MAGEGELVGGIYAEVEMRTEKSTAQLEEVRQKMATTRDSLELLSRVYQAGGVSTSTYDEQHQKLSRTLTELTGQARMLEATVQKEAMSAGGAAAKSAQFATSTSRMDVSLKGVASAGQASSYRMMQFGGVLDDIQYVGQGGMGLKPIVNNLMQIHPLLGTGAIMADLFFKHFGELKESLGDTAAWKSAEAAIGGVAEVIKGAAEGVGILLPTMKQLDEEKTMREEKAAADKADAKKQAKELEAVKGVQGRDAAAMGQAAKEAIGALGGGETILDKLTAQLAGKGANKEATASARRFVAEQMHQAMAGDQTGLGFLRQRLGGFEDVYTANLPGSKQAADEDAKVRKAFDEQRQQEIDEHNKAVEQRKKAAAEARQKLVDDMAENVQDLAMGAVGRNAARARPMAAQDVAESIRGRVRDRLRKGGLSDEQADDLAGSVAQQAVGRAGRAAGERAIREDTTMAAAAAAERREAATKGRAAEARAERAAGGGGKAPAPRLKVGRGGGRGRAGGGGGVAAARRPAGRGAALRAVPPPGVPVAAAQAGALRGGPGDAGGAGGLAGPGAMRILEKIADSTGEAARQLKERPGRGVAVLG